MKTQVLIFTIGFLLLYLSSYSQVRNDHKNMHHYSKANVVKKGYYSIGNNAEKLSKPTSLRISPDESFPAPQKGYFSIRNNNRKLGKTHNVEMDRHRSIPVIRKGYYSIGRNNEKLKQ